MSRSAIVLAGGSGSRIGGDKARALVGGVAMVDRVVRALSPLVTEVLVARGETALRVDGARMLDDAGAGPLAALLGAAREAKGEWVLVAPCDAPFLTPACYQRLLSAGHQGAVFEERGVPDPLVAVYKRKALLLAARRVSVEAGPRALLPMMDIAFLSPTPEEARALRDVDTRQDLESAQRSSTRDLSRRA